MRFGILGPLEALDDHGRQLELGARKQRAVLAILLLHRREPVSVERLSDELWGERAPATAAKTVQVYISRLRKSLGTDVLRTRGAGYMLSLAPGQLDVDRFERLAAEGRDALAAGDAAIAAQLLREALALWRGPPLADFGYESFAQAEIARLEESRLTTLEDRIDADLALGRHTQLVAELEALIRENALRERLSAQLMLALYGVGRQAGALDVYQQVRKHLAEELGLEPGPALKELQLQILEQSPSLEVTTRLDGSAVRPAGGAPQTAPRRSIPRPVTSLVGRAREVETVTNLVEDPEVRLVTLTGAGGVGKTRLAIAVARKLRDRIAGGTFMVRLAGVSDPASILPMIAEQVGVTGQSELPLLDVLARRFAAEPTLLVLDNFEQLIRGSGVLAELLAYEGELRVLVTTQVPLRIAAERVVRLGPLAPADAVGLFVERAAAVLPAFAPEGDELTAIEAICARLDFMPLAIELAAARSQVLPPRELAERLERPLDVLTRGERDAPARQRSLRAAIGWTHALLDPGQQSLLARLAVCAGSAPLSLVEAVAGPETEPAHALDRLEALIEFSFVRRREDPELGVRFLIPQALRDFALERLSATGDEDRVRLLHAGYVAEVAHPARLWRRGATPDEHRGLLAIGDEIRPAVAWSRQRDPALHVRICAGLSSYWVYAGVLSEATEELRHARDSGVGSATERAWILTMLAKCVQLQGGSGAVELVSEALAEWQSVDDERERALAMGPVGWVLRWEGRNDQAIEMQRDALAVLRRTGEPRLILRGLAFLANALADNRDVDSTEAVLEEADRLAAGDPGWELAAIHADCANDRGDHAGALKLYAESLSWTRTTRESHQIIMDLRCIATELALLGAWEAALEVFELVRLEEERTGRVGNSPVGVEWHEPSHTAAQRSVTREAAERAAERAREVPVAERAAYAIELARQVDVR